MVEHLEKSMVSIYLDALFGEPGELGELGEHSALNNVDGFLDRCDVLARPEIVKGGAENCSHVMGAHNAIADQMVEKGHQDGPVGDGESM